MLQMGQSSHEILNVDNLAHFISCLFNSFAIFPVRSTAAEQPNPVIDWVFDVCQKIELLFWISNSIRETECSLSSNQLVSILIILHEKEREKSKNYREKSPNIAKRFIKFPIFPLQLFTFSTHPDLHDHVARLCECLRIVSGSLSFLHIISCLCCFLFPWEKTFISFHLISPK